MKAKPCTTSLSESIAPMNQSRVELHTDGGGHHTASAGIHDAKLLQQAALNESMLCRCAPLAVAITARNAKPPKHNALKAKCTCSGRLRTGGSGHDSAPIGIHDAKLLALFGHLLDDVIGGEDWLEVEPRCLALQQWRAVGVLYERGRLCGACTDAPNALAPSACQIVLDHMNNLLPGRSSRRA